MPKQTTDKLKAALRQKSKPTEPPIKPGDGLSTGSTLLNLALSGHLDWGLCKSRYFAFIGDSDSGKTMLTQTCFAEAAQNKNFNDYDFVFYNREDGALMDFAKFFGGRMASRVKVVKAYETPTIESFYYDIDDRLKTGPPLIAVVDSQDAFSAEADDAKFEERKAAFKKGKDAAGSFGMAKAKTNSQNLRTVINNIVKTGSIVIFIRQTRDNVDPMSYETKTSSGGRSLKFYAAAEIWTSQGPRLNRTVLGQQMQIGITSQIYVKRNRITGKEWKVTVPIYHSVGIDETGSLVDFLVLWKRWPKEDKGGKITATDFEFAGSREAIVKRIENDGLLLELKSIVLDVWQDIEARCAVERKPRYE